MKKLLWIDLEMTGLSVDKEVILEVGAIITDLRLNSLTSYHATIKQPKAFLDNMDEWNQTHHTESGLIQRMKQTGKDQNLVENELIEWLTPHFQNEKAILCGNSILQDRVFINKHLPVFAKKLHYRMLDVTSWKLIFNNLYGVQFKKQVSHRALEDIRESIEEMKTYLKYISCP